MNRLFKNRNSRDKNYCLYVSSDSIINNNNKKQYILYVVKLIRDAYVSQ